MFRNKESIVLGTGHEFPGSAVVMLARSMLAKVFNVGIVTNTIGSDAGQ